MLVALLTGCGNGGQAAVDPSMMAMPVTVMAAQPQPIPVMVEAVGQAEGSKQVEVRARVSGILTRQLYKEGDRVKAGAPLFTIDPVAYDIALSQARASLTQEQANLERAQRDAARLKPLVEQRAISQKEYDDATSALKMSDAMAAASMAKMREAQLNLAYTRVTAPISGVTGRAQQSEGSLVTPLGDAGLLTTVSVTDPLWVRFSLSESETLHLRKAGGKTVVRLVLPDGSTYDKPGKLNFAASTVDPRIGTVALRAEFPNPKLTLLPGQFVRVQMSIGERQAYLIPQSAVSQGEQGKVLFTVSADNKVVPHTIETDGWSGNNWVVTTGLAPGDKIIIDNLMKLRPGAAVAPHGPEPAPNAAGPGGPGNGQAVSPAPGTSAASKQVQK